VFFKRKQRLVLLCGPMGGGATTLWHALQQRSLPNGTVTSMLPNEATATLPVRPRPRACCWCMRKCRPVSCSIAASPPSIFRSPSTLRSAWPPLQPVRLDTHTRTRARLPAPSAEKRPASTQTALQKTAALLSVYTHRGQRGLSVQGTATTVQLVDVPGHPRMQSIVQERCRDARAVVFVLDAGAFATQKAEIAGRLHDVLASLAARGARGGGANVLVACNKSDLGVKAFSDSFIVKQLEKEIGTLVETRGAKLGSGASGKGGGGGALQTPAGGPFALATCGVPVRTCRLSAATGDLTELLGLLRASV
jgi:GTPase SAR1 family protein